MASPWRAQRLTSSTTTIFAEMSALAVATGSVNLGPGLPGQRRPGFMLDAARQAIADGVNQYPPGRGIAPLRQAIAAHTRRHQRPRLRPRHRGPRHHRAPPRRSPPPSRRTWTRVTRSSRSNPSTTRTPPRSTWPAGSVVGVGLFGPDFRLDHAELAAAFGPRTKLVLINSPHNPTGVVLGDDDLAAIARLAVEHDVLVVTDEVYEHLVFDGCDAPLAGDLPGDARTHGPHLLVRQDVLGDRLEDRLGDGPRRADRRGDGGQAVPDLRLRRPLPARGRAGARRGRRLDRRGRSATCRTGATSSPTGLASVGLDPVVPQGTFFMTTDVRPLGYDDGMAFCRDLPHRAGVVAIPHQVFYADVEAGRPVRALGVLQAPRGAGRGRPPARARSAVEPARSGAAAARLRVPAPDRGRPEHRDRRARRRPRRRPRPAASRAATSPPRPSDASTDDRVQRPAPTGDRVSSRNPVTTEATGKP